MSKNCTWTYEECVAKYPPTEKAPFKISADRKKVFDIKKSIEGSLIIPVGVEEVEFDRYGNCYENLTAVILPDTVKEFRGQINCECAKRLECVRFSAGMESLWGHTDIENIKYVIIPEGIKYLHEGAITGRKTEICLPDSIEYVFPKAFQYCEFDKITIPSGVKAILPGAFYKCTQLKDIIVSSPDTVIMEGAFEDCPAIKDKEESLYKEYGLGDRILGEDEVRYSEDGTVLEDVPLYYCGPLKIKDGTIKYSSSPDWCRGITELSIPDSWDYYIPSVPNMKKLSLPKIYKYSDELSINSSELEEINQIPENITELIIQHTKIQSLNLADTKIETLRIRWARSLLSIDLPKTLKKIELMNLDQLKSLHLPEGITLCDLTHLTNLTSLELPSSLKIIRLWTLDKIKEVTVPENVTKLMIREMKSLTGFNIPPKLEEIESEAFKWNVSLGKIYIPNTVKKIGPYAFESCRNLNEIEIQGRPKPKISATAFKDCPGWPIKK